MKISIVLLLFSSVICVNTSCKKDAIEYRPGDPGDPVIPDTRVMENRPPAANAGVDLIVELQVNETFLNGSCSYWKNKPEIFKWAKVSGPGSYNLENENAMRTKLSGMEKGIYQFEFTVTDPTGLYDTDTILVIVGEISANPTEVIFKDVNWTQSGLLWGSLAEVKNIYNDLPVGSVFKVFILADSLLDWSELAQNSDTENYTFFLKDGHLYIYSNYSESGAANIKVVY